MPIPLACEAISISGGKRVMEESWKTLEESWKTSKAP